MQLLIHFLGGENSLIVHLEFKVSTLYSFLKYDIEAYKVAMAFERIETIVNW
jgi:hypothetical protein